MASFITLRARCVVLEADDVDTDQIIPARFLKITDKLGLGAKLFCDWRYLADGSPNPAFVLERPDAKGAEILVAGINFACGSSREHAPWALVGWGFRAVIARSFADIFKGNALKNGLVPIVVDARVHANIVEGRARDPKSELEIDLATQMLTLTDGERVGFDVDSFAKHCLLHGVDELGYLSSFETDIAAYERARSNHTEKQGVA